MAKKVPKIDVFWPWRAEFRPFSQFFLQITSKYAFFGPGGPNFAKIKKMLENSLTFTPERLYTKFQKIWLIRLGENALQTNERTDGTEIIGPSGKIPGTNNWPVSRSWGELSQLTLSLINSPTFLQNISIEILLFNHLVFF